jgi:pyochelin biosynthesis protein PchG
VSTARTNDRPMRVVVCGTTFGQFYLAALAGRDLPFVLAGILARGSARSRACATRYDTVLYTEVSQLPPDVDIACVVVRSGAVGGRGTDLARSLMARGIHVLQEHPVHHDELAVCLTDAHRHHVVYRLNTFYPHLAPVRQFLAVARRLLGQQPALFVDAVCAIQVAYPLLDILGQALGGVHPWRLTEMMATLPEDLRQLCELDVPFRSLQGVIAGVPLTLRVQNQVDPGDPDNHLYLLHRITIGTEGGDLALTNTHGPILWSPRLYIPGRSKEAFDPTAPDSEHLGVPSATWLGPQQAPSFLEIFQAVWPAGVAHALLELRRAILDGEDPRRRGQYQLGLCRLWQDLTARLGYPEMVHRRPPRTASVPDLTAAAEPPGAETWA